jgi:hypothetical protein
MSTLANILDRIATDEAALTGSPKTFNHDAAPNALKNAHLPCFINVPSNAPYQPLAFGMASIWQTRPIRILYYHTPIQMPGDVARWMNALEPIYQRVIAKFKSDYTLNGLVSAAIPESETGMIAAMEWAGKNYAGFEFVLRVEQGL